ncbi:MAG TPA: hypothetical protein VNG29_02220 [Candidatus Paceibacterota bacterium]|nr:hypothetical protein [Candidatus Paceibacterota bacterium]
MTKEPKSQRANELRNGQAMILTVLTLGGAILGATTIAGLIMTYQIRQTTDAADSAKAIFAADAGVECGLYQYFDDPTTLCPDGSLPKIANGATYSESINSSTQTLYSQGTAGTAQRAFIVLLGSATTTFP